jgi:transcriptional regulator with XRE-family HTH domain
MGRARQTFERRQLGLTLRRLREHADQTQQAAADAIGRVRSRIVELEEGKGTLNQTDLTALLNFYQVHPDEVRTVLALGVRARRRQRNHPYSDALPDSLLRFADLEASATEIRGFESTLIPGLLQSPDYLRAIMREADGIWWERSDDERHVGRIALREERQDRTWNSSIPRMLHFVIGEEAVRANVGGVDVMRGQLRHILHLLKKRDDVTVQILRLDSPNNPARGGGFSLLDFAEDVLSVAVSFAVYGPEQYFDAPEDTAMFRRAFDRLSSELALSPVDSANLISDLATNL